jgi:pyrimidine deaminase RibD-like protein
VIINEILTVQSDAREELDRILARCCELVLNGQREDPDHWGMVAACVVLPTGELVYGVNYEAEDGRHVHAERAALERCEDVSPECVVVTTLSPCNSPMDERAGESCEDLLASYGITHVYCGYKDPTQDADTSIETRNPKLRELCKKLADTFLAEDAPVIKEPTFADGQLKFTNHVNARANQRGISMSDIMQVLKRLEALRGADLKKLPPTGFIVRTDKFDLAMVKSQDIDTKKIEYIPTTVRQRLKTGAGQRVIYLEDAVEENFDDGRVKGRSRPGRVKRAGASCSGSVTSLRSKAKAASGERAKMYHWCANMKSGRQKNEDTLDEKWTKKYKKSINCAHPKGFSQRAHCQGRKKK